MYLVQLLYEFILSCHTVCNDFVLIEMYFLSHSSSWLWTSKFCKGSKEEGIADQ